MKRKGGGGSGVGTGQGTGQSTRTRLLKLPFSDLPCSFSPTIPPYCALCVSTWPIGCDTPPSGGAIPPPHKALGAQRYLRCGQGKMGAIPPSATLSRKGIARYGGYLALGRQGYPLYVLSPLSLRALLTNQCDFQGQHVSNSSRGS